MWLVLCDVCNTAIWAFANTHSSVTCNAYECKYSCINYTYKYKIPLSRAVFHLIEFFQLDFVLWFGFCILNFFFFFSFFTLKKLMGATSWGEVDIPSPTAHPSRGRLTNSQRTKKKMKHCEFQFLKEILRKVWKNLARF